MPDLPDPSLLADVSADDMPQATSESMAAGEPFGITGEPAAPGMGGGGFGGESATPAPSETVSPKSGFGRFFFSKEDLNRSLQLGEALHAKPQKGSARLSVNVNLDVPADYRARDFVSVADAVHQPSVLSLVVQRRRQIAAIRLVAALVVILLAWRLRSASLLWKLTLAISMLLIAVGLSPLLSNAWQSVVDGVALGALVSVAMALICSCCRNCECPWISLKRQTVSAA